MGVGYRYTPGPWCPRRAYCSNIEQYIHNNLFVTYNKSYVKYTHIAQYHPMNMPNSGSCAPYLMVFMVVRWMGILCIYIMTLLIRCGII